MVLEVVRNRKRLGLEGVVWAEVNDYVDRFVGDVVEPGAIVAGFAPSLEAKMCRAGHPSRRYSGLRSRRKGISPRNIEGTGSTPIKVGLVVERLLLAGLDHSVEELGHLFVVLGVNGELVDDDFSQVVLDRFGYRLGIDAQALWERVDGGRMQNTCEVGPAGRSCSLSFRGRPHRG
ncbi:MAG: hypothetical protein HY329_24570 [Chloroflexi bacterium]|nr:hypothetical protein [Chloroflexota bacterium]